MKITTKTTKETLKTFLGLNAGAVKEADKDLFDRLVYADKMLKTDENKVSRTDLIDLAKEVIKVLGDKCVEPKSSKVEETPVETPTETSTETTETPVEPKAENSTKRLSKTSKKTQNTSKAEEQKTAETPVEQSEEPKAEEKVVDEKKSAKKSSLGKKKSKKDEPKKDGVTVLEGTEKTVQLAKMFPEVIESGDNKYEIAHDIKGIDELYDALSKEENIIFAFYWTERHLRQFPYFGELLGQPESFENDLDLCAALWVSENKKVVYALSLETEAFYTILPDALKEKDGLRITSGVEYQIYRAV